MTGTAEKLAARAEDLPEGSMRRRVLEGARRFKSAWVEFGRLLSEVKRSGAWREWGHPSFERYCSKELFLRAATADKLTASYGFLERHEPQLARPAAEGRAPPFEVIEVLSRAEAAGRLPEDGWSDLREEVLERPPTPAALNRQLTQRYGAPEPRKGPADAGEDGVKKLAALAHRLAAACAAEERVSRAVVERARALADDLDDLLA